MRKQVEYKVKFQFVPFPFILAVHIPKMSFCLSLFSPPTERNASPFSFSYSRNIYIEHVYWVIT